MLSSDAQWVKSRGGGKGQRFKEALEKSEGNKQGAEEKNKAMDRR